MHQLRQCVVNVWFTEEKIEFKFDVLNRATSKDKDKLMIRISGILLPEKKPIYIALCAIFGIGPKSAKKILAQAQIDPTKRVSDISVNEENRIRSIIEVDFKVEGDLRAEISTNIKRLKEIKTYRGIRHGHNLPVRGQRTKTNARTKRGKKVTVGSGRKKSSEKT